MLEKTIDSIAKQNQRVRQQQIRHHEAIQKANKTAKRTALPINTRRERYPTFSFGGVKCGYATLTGGLITTLFSPWNGFRNNGPLVGFQFSNLYHIKRMKQN